MSVHEHGGGYRVRWYQGGRQHSKTFARRPDADLYDLEIKRAKALGPHIMRELQRGTQTFEEFIRGDWTDHAASLAPKTRAKYRWVLENHVGGLLSEPLAMIDGQRLARHQRQLLARGLRPNTVREILTALGAILQVAVDYGHIPHNPARSLRKVRRDPRKPIVVLEPGVRVPSEFPAGGENLAHESRRLADLDRRLLAARRRRRAAHREDALTGGGDR